MAHHNGYHVSLAQLNGTRIYFQFTFSFFSFSVESSRRLESGTSIRIAAVRLWPWSP
eukprot:COSAG01_NODE_32063_length_586_cov_0.598361_1_plen_56_part_01